MGKLERITAEVPVEMAKGIRAAVGAGAYASTDEAVREALTHWLVGRSTKPMTPNALRDHLQAERNGPGEDADAVFNRLEAKYSALVAADQPKG